MINSEKHFTQITRILINSTERFSQMASGGLRVMCGAFCLLLAACSSKPTADLLVYNARIYTVDSAFSTADAMLIKDGKIIAVGNTKIGEGYAIADLLNAKGNYIYPGFIDAHCHFSGYATDMWKCQLVGTKSFEEITAKLQDYAKTAPMQWLYGRGWDQNDWAVKKFPDRAVLDSLFPDRPVFLKRIDGHAAILNQKALDLAGIKPGVTFKGGEAEMINGRLTGILIDEAMSFAEKAVPEIEDSLAQQYFTQAEKYFFERGLTGAHDCGISEKTFELLKKAYSAGLRLKIFALLSDDSSYYDRWVKSGPYKTENFTVGGFKLYADGALGSRGACLLHPYADAPGRVGFLLRDQDYFRRMAQKLAGSQLQMCTHAIGDSGNRTLLNIYAEVLKGKNDRRWRIEHAQVLNPADYHFFSDYSIIPSVQPTHATSDMYWAGDRVGAARLKDAYAYQNLLRTNSWMPLGTDFPVEYLEPIKTFYAAVVRKDATGFPAGGFQIENALTREQALRGMTIWAARAAFQEKEKGSLERGKAADFVMLDNDLMKAPENSLLNVRVLQTRVNGKKVYSAKR